MTAPTEPLKPEKCIWKRDPDGESYVWVIGCTNEFSIEPDAEEYGHCVECGRGIELVTAPLEDHEGRWPQREVVRPAIERDDAAELRAALVKMADLVYTIASADEELSFPHYEDSERTRSHLLAHRRAKKAAWEELQELAAEYDGVPALATSEGSES